jgi:hypothetical protein
MSQYTRIATVLCMLGTIGAAATARAITPEILLRAILEADKEIFDAFPKDAVISVCGAALSDPTLSENQKADIRISHSAQLGLSRGKAIFRCAFRPCLGSQVFSWTK